MAELNITIGIEDNASRQIREIDRALNGLNRNLGGLGNSSNSASGGLTKFSAVATGVAAGLAAVAVSAVAAGKAIVGASTSITQIQNKLSLISSSNEELTRSYERLQTVAVQNRTSFADTVDLYSRLTLATESLGYSAQEVEQVTTKFSQALAVSGADANTASGAITQFAQAMGSGYVRGDEFNSIVDALGPALAIMARESGLTVGELRKMANEGKLTSQAFADLLLGSTQLSEKFNQMEETIPQVTQKLADSWDRFLASVDKTYGVSRSIADALDILNTAIDTGVTPDTFSSIETEMQTLEERMGSLRKEADRLSQGMSGADIVLNTLTFGSQNPDLFAIQKELNAASDRMQELMDKRAEMVSRFTGQDPSTVTIDDVIAQREMIALYDRAAIAISEYEARVKSLNDEISLRGGNGTAASLADSLIGQDSATTIEQAKAKVAEYSQAMYQLTDAFDLARMQDQSGLELIQLRNQYYERMNALQAQQVLNLQALTAAQNENAAAIISANPDLVPQYMREAQALDAKRALLQQITIELAGNTNLTEQNRASLEAMSATLRSQIAELQQGSQSVSQFEQYYQQLIASSNAAVASQDNVGAAVARLDADLRAGIISLDTYAAAMQQLGDVTPPTFDQQLITLKGNVDAALAQNAANEKLVATLKEQGATTAQITEAERQLGIVRKVSRGGGGARVEKLDPYEQFYKGVVDQATRAANEIPFAEQALAQLNKEFEAGTISLEVYKRASEQINEVLAGKTVSVVGVIQDSLSSLAGSISSTLTDVFMGVKGGFEGLQDIALSVVRTIVNSLIQNFIVSPLLKNINSALSAAFTPSGGGMGGGLFGGLFGGGGGLFSMIGGLFGLPFFEGGGYTGAGARAGGLDGKGGFPAIMHPNETVIDHTKGQTVPGGEPLQVVFNINAIDSQTGTEFLMKNKQVIVGAVQQAYNRKGQRGPLG